MNDDIRVVRLLGGPPQESIGIGSFVTQTVFGVNKISFRIIVIYYGSLFVRVWYICEIAHNRSTGMLVSRRRFVIKRNLALRSGGVWKRLFSWLVDDVVSRGDVALLRATCYYRSLLTCWRIPWLLAMHNRFPMHHLFFFKYFLIFIRRKYPNLTENS